MTPTYKQWRPPDATIKTTSNTVIRSPNNKNKQAIIIVKSFYFCKSYFKEIWLFSKLDDELSRPVFPNLVFSKEPCKRLNKSLSTEHFRSVNIISLLILTVVYTIDKYWVLYKNQWTSCNILEDFRWISLSYNMYPKNCGLQPHMYTNYMVYTLNLILIQ